MRNKGIRKFTTPSIRYDCLREKNMNWKNGNNKNVLKVMSCKLIYLHFSYMFEIKELENIKQLIYSSNNNKIKQRHPELMGKTHTQSHTHTHNI